MTAAKQTRLVRAELESPFVSQGLWANAPGLDTALVRDHQDRIIFPGSQLQGVLLAILENMLEAKTEKFGPAHLVDWFGQGSGDAYGDLDQGLANPFEPQKGRVHIGDLVCQLSAQVQGGTGTRIAISEDTGSVQEGALQVLEQPFPLGKGVPFAGEMTFWGSEEQAALFWEVASLALSFLPALGGIKTPGFGNLVRPIALEDQGSPPVPMVDLGLASTISIQDRLAFELEFLEPFVVDAELIGGNIYQGSPIIPGAVIKGCLAHKLKLAGALDDELGTALAEVLVSHAFPIKADDPAAKRPRAVPFSLIQRDQKKDQGESYEHHIFDCFWQPDAAAWQGHLVAYPIDWKGAVTETALAKLGWPGETGYHVRTRTAIKSEQGVVSKGQLFSYREVVPVGLRWRFLLDRGEVGEGAFRQIVAALLSGLDFVGKTDAAAQCRLVADADAEVTAATATFNGQAIWRVTLQTPALLLDTEDACRQPGQEEAPSVKDLYETYWREVVKLDWPEAAPTLNLVDFRAVQKWEGGYRARRFRQRDGCYAPYLLTQPGSVFLLNLEGVSQQAQAEFFSRLVRRGLPVRFQGQAKRDPALWQRCPYPPENGFGEVRVDWEDARRFERGVPCA
ncbi:MAG: hypothetical protein V1806_12345 [Pseudomonadota bacterium]